LKTHFDGPSGLLKQNVVAKRGVELSIEGKRLRILKGEEVNICQSGKWEQLEVKIMTRAAGIKIIGAWHHEDEDYGKHDPLRRSCAEPARFEFSRRQRNVFKLTERRYVPFMSALAYIVKRTKATLFFGVHHKHIYISDFGRPLRTYRNLDCYRFWSYFPALHSTTANQLVGLHVVKSSNIARDKTFCLVPHIRVSRDALMKPVVHPRQVESYSDGIDDERF